MRLHLLLSLSFLVFQSGLTSWAEPGLPALFSDHAVLQRASAVPVWGKAAPGEAVQVSLGKTSQGTVAGPEGRWRVVLDLSQAPAEPQTLVVAGIKTLTVKDVLVGEVWLASGQSNMAWAVRSCTGAKADIAASTNPSIRHFKVETATANQPAEDLKGKWEIADPASTGGFTATGYYFARSLQQALGVPVGLLNASVGGTPIEAWTSLEGLGRDPQLSASAKRYRDYEQGFAERLALYQVNWGAWAARHGRQDTAVALPASTVEWRPFSLAEAKTPGLPAAGNLWLRHSFQVSPGEADMQQALNLGAIDGFYTVYFNGVEVGSVTPAKGAASPGAIYVKGDLIKAGTAVLTLRIFNPAGAPMLQRGAVPKFIGRPLQGLWLFHVERSLPVLGPEALAEMPVQPMQPMARNSLGAYLYNGMIAPLVPYAIRGALWYQGETNSPRAWQYRTAFPLMIQDWRSKWGQGDFPFYYCQLANFGDNTAAKTGLNWAELREAQTSALKLPNTGQVVLIDVGEEGDVHARDKRSVGVRLACVALAKTYGRPLVASGPSYRSMSIEGPAIRLRFDDLGGGLVAVKLPETYRPRSTVARTLPVPRLSPGSELEGFSICGSDQKWTAAEARIDGESVLVSASSVPSPVAVRYAWSGSPVCNLANAAGLPASPFRTDAFPANTLDSRY
jgi:sialate O-acetylesterase